MYHHHLTVEITVDDDSNVIMAMLENLIELGEIMGGDHEYTNFFPLMEEVMQNEENKIREKVHKDIYNRQWRFIWQS